MNNWIRRIFAAVHTADVFGSLHQESQAAVVVNMATNSSCSPSASSAVEPRDTPTKTQQQQPGWCTLARGALPADSVIPHPSPCAAEDGAGGTRDTCAVLDQQGDINPTTPCHQMTVMAASDIWRTGGSDTCDPGASRRTRRRWAEGSVGFHAVPAALPDPAQGPLRSASPSAQLARSDSCVLRRGPSGRLRWDDITDKQRSASCTLDVLTAKRRGWQQPRPAAAVESPLQLVLRYGERTSPDDHELSSSSISRSTDSAIRRSNSGRRCWEVSPNFQGAYPAPLDYFNLHSQPDARASSPLPRARAPEALCGTVSASPSSGPLSRSGSRRRWQLPSHAAVGSPAEAAGGEEGGEIHGVMPLVSIALDVEDSCSNVRGSSSSITTTKPLHATSSRRRWQVVPAASAPAKVKAPAATPAAGRTVPRYMLPTKSWLHSLSHADGKKGSQRPAVTAALCGKRV